MRKIFFFSLIAVSIVCACHPPASRYDVIIRNGLLYDGTGAQPFNADIGINGDTIAFIGDLSAASARSEFDANGKAVSPGFIDTHSHHAGGLFDHRDCLAAVSQGITTIIVGQDGDAFFPLSVFYRHLSDTPVAVNIGSYSGHNTIREAVLGKTFKRTATLPEVDSMKRLLQKDLEAGALGLSTGLEYDPGIYSTRNEVMALAKVLAPYHGRYISHIRSEDRAFWEAIDEVIQIGAEAKIPVQVSHIKLAMHTIWGMADSVLMLFDDARKRGIDITADIYPYTYWHSTIKVLFPERNFTDKKEAERILKEVTLPQDIILGAYEVNKAYAGKSLLEIAGIEHKPPATMLVELIGRLDAWEKKYGKPPEQNILATSMDQRDIKRFMQWTHTNICSDGASHGSHPRGYGAFTRMLGKYVREEKTLPLTEAIQKMTSLAAAHMGILKRGVLRQGYYADIVLFDAATVQDAATVTEPHKPSEGVDAVMVNGVIVYTPNKPSGKYPGMIIKRQQ